MLGDIDIGTVGWSWHSPPWQWAHILSQRSPWQFEALAMLEMGALVILFSPVNLLIATALSALLGLNLHGALALRQNAHCTAIASAGVWPSLLAGGACYTPSLLLLLGIPGLGVFVSLFAWMVPLALILLLISRCWQRRQSAPALWALF
jgi:hypothetical protein